MGGARGKGAYVTDGGGLGRLDPASGLVDRIDLGPEIVGLPARDFDGRVLLATSRVGPRRDATARRSWPPTRSAR